MHCECSDYKENINKINAGFVFSSTHGIGGYTGKIIKYCPWCGKELLGEYGKKRKYNL